VTSTNDENCRSSSTHVPAAVVDAPPVVLVLVSGEVVELGSSFFTFDNGETAGLLAAATAADTCVIGKTRAY